MYEIETDIEIPSKTGGKRVYYPFAEMDVEGSFFAPFQEGKSKKIGQNLVAYAKRHFPDRKHTTRVYPDGVRIWRIS